MGAENLNPLLVTDPVSGRDLYISELACDDSGVTIRGRFEMPRYARLDAEQRRFLETFLQCRGVLSSVERELGISYPTVRARLDALLGALDLKPVKEDVPKAPEKSATKKRAILDKLERGEITPEEAKERLKELAK